jgi:hypothetical protein
MINLIDSELISLKQDIEEMWMLVYNHWIGQEKPY